MSKFILVFILFFVANSSFCQKQNHQCPPGTIWVSEGFYVDKTEISNLDWFEYMIWTKNFYGPESEKYLATIPDYDVWENDGNEVLSSLYFQHPAYERFPVVGITYEQAVAYCEWRSQRVNWILHMRMGGMMPDSDDTTGIVQKYRYRLPTEDEWLMLASVDFSDKTKRDQNKKKNINSPIYNFYFKDELTGEVHTNPSNIFSRWPNALGIYCVIGNVAEMTSEKGLAKGGSWKDNASEFSLDKDFLYEKQEVWLGFRCVCDEN